MIDRRLLKLQVEEVTYNEFRDEVITHKEVPVVVTLFKEEMESVSDEKRKNYRSSLVLNGFYHDFVDRESGEPITEIFTMTNNEGKRKKTYKITEISEMDNYNCKVYATESELKI